MGADLWLRPSWQMLTSENLRKSWLEACSQFGRGCPLWGRECPFPALAAPPPASSWGWPVRSQLALLWYLLSPLFCEQSGSALVLGFSRNSSLSLSLFPSLSLAIPPFRFLSHVSSLRLPSKHSGLVLTLSNAACSSTFSPCLLVAEESVWDTSHLGVAVRDVSWVLFIFPPGFVAL